MFHDMCGTSVSLRVTSILPISCRTKSVTSCPMCESCAVHGGAAIHRPVFSGHFCHRSGNRYYDMPVVIYFFFLLSGLKFQYLGFLFSHHRSKHWGALHAEFYMPQFARKVGGWYYQRVSAHAPRSMRAKGVCVCMCVC